MDFQGVDYNDYKDCLKNDLMKIEGLIRAPHCFKCGLETQGKDAWGNSTCSKCIISYASARVDNNEIHEHHEIEWMRASK